MITTGLLLAVFSGICNGLFSAPMRLERRWKWENIWFTFILMACIIMPALMVYPAIPNPGRIFAAAPSGAVISALTFGFAWGFGAICFGLSVDRLGVSIANSLIIGLSSALGSLVPLLISGAFRLDRKQTVLLIGIATFLLGVWLCGQAGRLRDAGEGTAPRGMPSGYLFALCSGIMSAVFNIGYTLALPIASTGVELGHSLFASTNCIWLLMLGAGSIPNIAYCLFLMFRNRTTHLMRSFDTGWSWMRSIVMGLLWGGSIFLYGAATPRLGDIGPSIGWPLSLAVGLLVANLMGVLLGEWREVSRPAARRMNFGVLTLLIAIVICALATKVGL
ncbi:MAG TPA: L-rhamnose/proton symporter RhaT [Bryobacteraceae bacterium]|jgi:L-rhamnose-H+ transport protein|nr:L-rhamnose/proton symporter RhaT [Bryobacteraceae bacterium]